MNKTSLFTSLLFSLALVLIAVGLLGEALPLGKKSHKHGSHSVHHISAKPHRLPRGAGRALANAKGSPLKSHLARFAEVMPKQLQKQFRTIHAHHQQPALLNQQQLKKDNNNNNNLKASHPLLTGLVPAPLKKQLLAAPLQQHDEKNGGNGGVATLALEEGYYFYTAEIALGTPAQNFTVGFTSWSTDLDVAEVGAPTDDSDSDYADYGFSSDYDVREFNASASSTYKAGGNYTVDFGSGETYTFGSIAIDTLAISEEDGAASGRGIQAPGVSFGLLDDAFWLAYLEIDGIFGLDTAIDEVYTSIKTPVLRQLADANALKQPIITTRVNEPIDGSEDPTVEITLGAEESANCGAPTSRPTDESYFGIPVFNISSVSVAGEGGASRAVNYSVAIAAGYWWPITADNETVKLIVDAAGAVANYTFSLTCSGETFNVSIYTVPSANRPKASSINLGAVNGQQVELLPADYIIEYEGDYYLDVIDERIYDCYYGGGGGDSSGYGDYGTDETDSTDSSSSTSSNGDDDDSDSGEKWIILGQQYVNNHCISTNIQTGVVGLGDVEQPGPATAP